MALGEDAQPFGIFLYTTGKTLIGEVKQRQPAGGGALFGQGAPLISSGVNAGRVVAAAVQQHQIAGLRFAERPCMAAKSRPLVAAS